MMAAGFVAVDNKRKVYATGTVDGTVDLEPGDSILEYESISSDDRMLLKLNLS